MRKNVNIEDQFGIKVLTKLRLGFCHLRGHKFTHDFNGNIKSTNLLYY